MVVGCVDDSRLVIFLNQAKVREALRVGDIKFESCNDDLQFAMREDVMVNLETKIPGLVQDGIKLLVYAGEYDIICNWLGKMFLITMLCLCS